MTMRKVGDRGVEVRKIQLLLSTALGAVAGMNADGVFGPRTHDAVVRFQRSKGLGADGVVGPDTRAALGLKPEASSKPASGSSPDAPWMDIAIAELGIHEDAAPGKHNQRVLEYHQTTTLKATTDETPWCSSFVNWVMIRAGQRGTNNALAKSWLNWGRALETPKAGAILVIQRKTTGFDSATGSWTGFHVAFFVSATPSHLQLLGGNQGHQGKVKYSNYLLSAYDLRGARWPT